MTDKLTRDPLTRTERIHVNDARFAHLTLDKQAGNLINDLLVIIDRLAPPQPTPEAAFKVGDHVVWKFWLHPYGHDGVIRYIDSEKALVFEDGILREYAPPDELLLVYDAPQPAPTTPPAPEAATPVRLTKAQTRLLDDILMCEPEGYQYTSRAWNHNKKIGAVHSLGFVVGLSSPSGYHYYAHITPAGRAALAAAKGGKS